MLYMYIGTIMDHGNPVTKHLALHLPPHGKSHITIANQ